MHKLPLSQPLRMMILLLPHPIWVMTHTKRELLHQTLNLLRNVGTSAGASSPMKVDMQPRTISTSNITPRRKMLTKMPDIQTKNSVPTNTTEQVHPTQPSAERDVRTTSKQDELSLMRKKLDDFKKLETDEFKNLRILINDNLTKVLQAIKRDNDSEKCAASESPFQRHAVDFDHTVDQNTLHKSLVQNDTNTAHFQTEAL
ncbi:uncharacterized protein LOC132628692 [Lycium barbarum]|uniref:uncharacterized protein LOC132628692 n=1 Tax=Lycium barbarum TaxID=112863 RepID=UPI00293E4ED4|nr:uncharacterized protein LOC132628692 [Lycium barbarum]